MTDPTTPEGRAELHICPVTYREACDFVQLHHRHHAPPQGHKYSIGVAARDRLVGVVIVGRPIARHYDDGRTVEVTRSATDGTAHANSMLYGAAWRAAKALGYRRLITYTQAGESGSSLRGAGWRVIADRPARPGWDCPTRPRIDRGTGQIERTLLGGRMTFTYCDARYDGTPTHRCLCQRRVMHNGAHKCACGHTWGLNWNHLTYDQQRELCGLPPATPRMRLDRLLRGADLTFTSHQWLPGDPHPIVGQRIAYTDQDGRVHDAGIVTEFRSVNNVVTLTTQKRPPEYHIPQRWLIGTQDIEERP